MKLSYILLLSVSATMQVIASEIANPDTQSASGVAAKEEISVGKQYTLDPEGLIRSSHVHTLNSPPGENADIEARAAKDKAKGKQGNKPAKGTPATAQPAKGNPAKGTPAKPTPAKPTPTPKNPPKGKTGKCMRQVTMKSSSGKGKPAKAKPGKGKVVKRTYMDFLKSRDAQATPMTFQTIAVRT
jgi:septal ring-binding cell division protein DamX